MMYSRPGCLRALVFCLLGSYTLLAQQPQAQPAKPPASQPPQQKKNNPFEAIPETTQQPTPQPPELETVKPLPGAPAADRPAQDVIESVEFRGARRVPQDTLKALIFTKQGDVYSEDALHRDFMA